MGFGLVAHSQESITIELATGESSSNLENANSTVDYIHLTDTAALSDSNFDGSTFTTDNYYISSSYGASIYLQSTNNNVTELKNVSFKNTTFDASSGDLSSAYQSFMWLGSNSSRAGYARTIVDNIDFSGSTIKGVTYLGIMYNMTGTNISFDNATVETATLFWLSSAKISDSTFTNMNITAGSVNDVMVTLSGNDSNWGSLTNVSFQGTTITDSTGAVVTFNESHIARASTSTATQCEIQNVILGDGKIYSTGIQIWDTTTVSDISPNIGIILKESDDVLTLRDAAYLDVDSTLSAGQLVFDGGTLELKAGTILTIDTSQGLEIVINNDQYSQSADGTQTAQATLLAVAEASSTSEQITIDISDLIFTEDGAEDISIAILDEQGNSLTGDAALDALSQNLKVVDAEGNEIKDFTLTDNNNLITNAVPEPSSVTLSLIALAGICARRRRRCAA